MRVLQGTGFALGKVFIHCYIVHHHVVLNQFYFRVTYIAPEYAVGIIGVCVVPVAPAFPQGVIGRTYADRGCAKVAPQRYDQFATPPYLGLCPEAGLPLNEPQSIVYGLLHFGIRSAQSGYVFEMTCMTV